MIEPLKFSWLCIHGQIIWFSNWVWFSSRISTVATQESLTAYLLWGYRIRIGKGWCVSVTWENKISVYLDWLFMFVLPVALLSDPCSRQSAISLRVFTLHSVDPASVITPFDVSRIWIGGFPVVVIFAAFPFAVSCLLEELGSKRSLTSSLWILH